MPRHQFQEKYFANNNPYTKYISGIDPKTNLPININKALHDTANNTQVEMNQTRKIFMTQWGDPGDPTMVAQFNIDVSCLDFFEKKFPPETVTTLMLQAVSEVLTGDDSFRSYISHKKMYQSQGAYVSIVVKLPNCDDHIGNIVFKDCHHMTLLDLAGKIRRVVQMMVYCYQKREQMEKKYPHLKDSLDTVLYDFAHDAYPYPIPGSPFVSVSGVGFSGYTQAISPLRKQEALKVTLLTIERKPVWNSVSQIFEAKDLMPVSVSADHRIFDGNLPIPKLLGDAFQHAFQRMLQGAIKPVESEKWAPNLFFGKLIDRLLGTNLILGYRTLVGLQTVWPDFMDIEDIVSVATTKNIIRTKLETWMS